jgi:uncharacterized protein (DUF2336 family)
VSERFRELEASQPLRKKDVVLLATVTSFEGLVMPGKSELRQFADLFVPLYQNSSDEARRLAVAALSQCETLPASVACFIASQPIDIAAPFLISSPALDDDMLMSVARMQGASHAKAIAARAALSVEVVDALASLSRDLREKPGQAGPADEEAGEAHAEIIAMPDRREGERRLAEELLRHELKFRVMRDAPSLSEDSGDIATRDALLVRFARSRAARDFSIVLADAMGSSLWLADRIMLDLSGEQLGTTLAALGLDPADSAFVLQRFYPHLAREQDGASRARQIIDRLDQKACKARIDAWIRADAYTTGTAAPAEAIPANRNKRPAAGSNITAMPRATPVSAAAKRRRPRKLAGS